MKYTVCRKHIPINREYEIKNAKHKLIHPPNPVFKHGFGVSSQKTKLKIIFIRSGFIMKLVIIGGDAAGMSAASRAKRNRPDMDITVLEQSQDVSYSA
jgi:hypothetical protein